MRIAITNWSRRKVGGVETYLNAVIPALRQYGHEVAFWYEMDAPETRDIIEIPAGLAVWCVTAAGAAAALAGLRAWQPEVIYAHKFHDPALEAQVQKLGPSVFFAHDYYGVCISGLKTFKFPVMQPCHRQFGWQCLLRYFPQHCGGGSPVTMLKLYQLQSQRLELLRRYDAIATHSEHMLTELQRNGIVAERVHSFPYFVKPPRRERELVEEGSAPLVVGAVVPGQWRLLFSGRMELLKGGHVLLAALPRVSAALRMPLHVTFAGDGRERARLEREARRLQARQPHLEIEFPGWLNQEQLKARLQLTDLLVVPSLWPEPFGLVGPEAGLHGVPVAAFGVGGIPDWLKQDVNGALAPGDPPTAEGLAEAIIRCLHESAHYTRLRRGASELARRYNIEEHLASLLTVFEHAIEHRRGVEKIA